MKTDTTGKFYFVSKKVGKALWDYKMIQDGDRVLVAVSGGKDSLCLLRILLERQKFVPINYEVLACYVDMGYPWVDRAAMVSHFEQLGVPYVIGEPPEMWSADREGYGCFWCSWNRRKALFALAAKHGCSKIAFGHHMDDIVETLLMNLLFNGQIGTMQPYQEMFGGEIYLIRPLAFVQEKELEGLARKLSLPVIKSQCPYGEVSKRRLVKGMIAEVGKYNKNVKKNIFRSLERIRKEYLLGPAGDET